MKQRKEFQKLLSERKLKKTSQRALIWGVLLEIKGHPSVEEIRDSLLAKGDRIGLATIYRTIKILLESGFVRQSKLLGITRYEPVINQPNHIHFTCNSCGTTVEFPSRRIENLIKRAARLHVLHKRLPQNQEWQGQAHVPAPGCRGVGSLTPAAGGTSVAALATSMAEARA